MNEQRRIIVVDDERGMRELLTHELGKRGFRVEAFARGELALDVIRKEKIPLLVTDVKMPGLGGLELLAAVKEADPDVEVLMMTGFATIDTAVTAMKNGACDFVQKPFDIEELSSAVERAFEHKELKATVAIYKASEALFRTVKLDELLPVIAGLAKSVLRADEAAVLLRREGRLEPAFGDCAVAEGKPKACEEALRGGEAVVVSEPSCGGDCRAALVYPLRVGCEKLGVLCLRRRADVPFNPQDVRHAAIFASQIALAVRNAQSFRSLEATQVRLVQSERMSAIGGLAAGVAHELNNPLTGVFGCAQMLQGAVNLNEEQRDDVACILEQARRCREIVQDLLGFSRSGSGCREAVSLDDVIETALRLSRFDAACREMAVAAARGRPGVCLNANARQLQQVFLNLVVNAAHAMRGSAEKRLSIAAEVEGSEAVVRVCDTGPGIAPEHLPRVFEPFFTTKEQGHGTGLGLAICREIVEAHGGSIAAESAPGRGAVFTVRLPCLPQRPPGAESGA